MNKLTGNKNLDIDIINQLSDNDLVAVCQVNIYIRNLCNSNTLWMKRISKIYKLNPLQALEIYKYLVFDNWKEFYLWLNEHIYIPVFIPVLLKSLANKERIDDLLNLIVTTTNFPRWINQEEYLRVLKQYLFLNLLDKIDTTSEYSDFEREGDTDYDYLSNALTKAEKTMNEEFLDNTKIYKQMHKRYNTSFIHETK